VLFASVECASNRDAVARAGTCVDAYALKEVVVAMHGVVEGTVRVVQVAGQVGDVVLWTVEAGWTALLVARSARDAGARRAIRVGVWGRGRVCRGGGESGEQDEGEEAETRRESGGHWEETGRDCVIRTFAQEIGLRAI